MANIIFFLTLSGYSVKIVVDQELGNFMIRMAYTCQNNNSSIRLL